MPQLAVAFDGPVIKAKPLVRAKPESFPAAYHPRDPTQSILFETICAELDPFLRELAERDHDGRGLPAYVERELRSFLDCGLVERGFLLLECDRCEELKLVPFSCKTCFCPSCAGRRMVEVAANLVDRILPFVPYRQLVLAFPMPVARLLARKPKLLAQARMLFSRAVRAFQRRAARLAGVPDARTGMVCLTQRFTSQLLTFPHFHALVPDGVFAEDDCGRPVFHLLAKPKDKDLERLLARFIRRLKPLLGSLDDDQSAPGILDWLEPPQSGARRPPLALPENQLCARVEGFSLHAARRIHQHDRPGLEALLQYALRPPISLDRLSRLPNGNLLLEPKRSLRSPTKLELSPRELLRRICCFCPQPRFHEIHYFGVFAPHSSWRSRVVPRSPARRSSHEHSSPAASQPPDERQLPLDLTALPPHLSSLLDHTEPPTSMDDLAPILPIIKAACPRVPYLDWASLLRRVHGFDVLACSCGGRRRVVALVTDRDRARELLENLGAPTRSSDRPPAGPRPPARPPPRKPPKPPPPDCQLALF